MVRPLLGNLDDEFEGKKIQNSVVIFKAPQCGINKISCGCLKDINPVQ